MIKEIGKKLKTARKTLGWTQKDISDKVHISRVYYSNIERGIQMPKLETFILIANTLKIPNVLEDYLLPKSPEDTKDVIMTEELNGLTMEECMMIKETIILMAKNFKRSRN